MKGIFIFSKVQLVLLLLVYQNLAAYLKFTNTVCESFNKSSVVINYCYLKAVDRYKSTFNSNVTFLYPVNNVSIRIQILKKANGYKPWLMDFTFDFCKYLKKHNHPVVKLLFGAVKDFSNVNHTCPYVGPVVVKNFSIQADNFPVPMPAGDYAVFLTWIFDNEPQYINKIYFTYVEDLLGKKERVN